MKDKIAKNILVILFSVSILIGGVFSYLYRSSPHIDLDIKSFQSELIKKELLAEKTLDNLHSFFKTSQLDSLPFYSFPDEDISFLIFEKGKLLFWSENKLDITDISLSDFRDRKYLKLNNAHSFCLSQEDEDVLFVALINIKHSYPYENDKLKNEFSKGFKLNRHVSINLGQASDKGAVFSKNRTYLFSLTKSQQPVFKKQYLFVSSAFYCLALILFFYIYASFPLLLGQKVISLRNFLFLFGLVFVVLTVLLVYRVPRIIFDTTIFSPFYYSANAILASIGHLSIFTFFVFSSIILFFFYLERKERLSVLAQLFFQLLFPLYCVLFYYVLQSLVFHSSVELSLLDIKKISLPAFWLHFLLFLWVLGLALLFARTRNSIIENSSIKRAICVDTILFVLLASVFAFFAPIGQVMFAVLPYFFFSLFSYLAYYYKKKQQNRLFLLLCCATLAFFVSANLLYLGKIKELEAQESLAKKLFFNADTENDKVADILLKELDESLFSDSKVMSLLSKPNSQEKSKDYLNKSYFRGYFKKYELQLNYARTASDVYREYMDEIAESGRAIKDTHFYHFPNKTSSVDYLGVYLIKADRTDSLYCFLELGLRQHYKSYSFPDLLIPGNLVEQSQNSGIAAKYKNQKLIYSVGNFDYPLEVDWIGSFNGNDTIVSDNSYTHFVYKPNETEIVVASKLQKGKKLSFLLFFLYLSFAYLLLYWFFSRLLSFFSQRKESRLGFVTRFQYTFISLFIINFVAIFYVSVNFIRIRYEKLQIDDADKKRSYIQRDLQEMYYWNQDLGAENSSFLNFDLQELSFIYQTDIHVFNNAGVLVGSSQPLIFSRHLISNRMTPKVFFSSNSNVEQYEQIGELNYQVSYTDFYNGDYLQIGYIAVPQFFSQENMRAEIETFSTMIFQIYLIIIIIAIFITLLVGRRLAAPLNMLAKKLKEMRLGERNEKIDYQQNDEIGELVTQYNRTVDELAESANLLAKSERESAWKVMAQQIAHEINNPLTPMKLSLQQLQRRKKMGDENFDQYFETSISMLIEQIDNLSRIAGTFSNFARMPEAKFNRVDVSSILMSVVRLFENNSKGVEIKYAAKENDVFVYADSEQLMQVFNNLLKNAIQSIPIEAKGLVQILVEKQDAKVFVRIVDNGVGIAKENWDKMFVPNFTTKAQGLGLGLAISKNIVEEFGGSIRFESEEGEGTCFIVELPIR